MLKRMSLQARLITLFLLFALLPAAAGGGVTWYLNFHSTRETTIHDNKIVSRQIGEQIRQMVDNSRGLVEALAAVPAARTLDRAAIREMIVAAQQKNPQFELIFAMDATGMQIARTSGNVAYRGDRPYFQEAIQGKVFFTDVYISAFTNAPCLTVSVPIKDAAGANVGVLAADISLKAVWEIADKVRLGQSGYVDVVDNQGTLIAHPVKERVLKKETVPVPAHLVQTAANENGFVEAESSRGEQALVVYTPVDKYKWGVIAYEPVDEVFSTLYQVTYSVVAVTLLAVLLAVWIGFLMAGNISKPLERLVEVAGRIAQGDLSQRADVRGVREVNELAAAFQTMTESLRSIIGQTMTATQSVSATAEELSASASEVGKASQQVAGNIQMVAAGAASQVDLAHKSGELIAQAVRASNQTATAAHTVAGVSEQSEQAAKNGAVHISQATNVMNRIRENVGQAAESINSLGKKSHQIGQIIDVITGLTGQTNLLALNAAIEAARAGEQGRGFAVVAVEVRKLAEQSEAAAKEIAAIVSAIQNETSEAVVAMEKGSREVGAGVEAVEASGAAFREIYEAVNHMGVQVAQIVALTEDQERSIRAMEDAVDGIVDAAQTNASSAQHVAAASQEQNAAVEEIGAATAELARMAANLQSTVVDFRL
ncbi:methyl-accepting chemotaxis protein [Acetonema longum]|uniref:Methyl-accepting chemotaxis sensory transducer n=1 Tax=Acetonema longum DSM 6540 TaxID=1009370 RepID=F7NJ08_9FIRM|nr:methyl-accepting chemotaxis protein [Acetonema longum]EGO64005.1 methyl-accepting chemotaxis sensory transducer [Acetonema longum DSM 6540]